MDLEHGHSVGRVSKSVYTCNYFVDLSPWRPSLKRVNKQCFLIYLGLEATLCLAT